MNKLKAFFAGAVLMAGSVAAQAASSVDVTPLADTKLDVAAVGAAVFGVLVAVAGFRYIRRLL